MSAHYLREPTYLPDASAAALTALENIETLLMQIGNHGNAIHRLMARDWDAVNAGRADWDGAEAWQATEAGLTRIEQQMAEMAKQAAEEIAP